MKSYNDWQEYVGANDNLYFVSNVSYALTDTVAERLVCALRPTLTNNECIIYGMEISLFHQTLTNHCIVYIRANSNITGNTDDLTPYPIEENKGAFSSRYSGDFYGYLNTTSTMGAGGTDLGILSIGGSQVVIVPFPYILKTNVQFGLSVLSENGVGTCRATIYFGMR